MNKLHEIFNIQPNRSLVFANDIDVHDIYQEAYQNHKIIEHVPSLMSPAIVVNCIDPRIVKGTDLCKWLCLSLKKSEDKKVFTKIPDHLSGSSLQTTLYRIAKSFGIKARVDLFEGHIVLRIREKKPAPALKQAIAVKEVKPHLLSVSVKFRMWVDSLMWDIPIPLPVNADHKYCIQVASKHYKGSVKVRNGILTKHSICLGKNDGFVCVLSHGQVIFTTSSRSLNKLTDSDVAGINLTLTRFSKTYEDIR